jgi:subtilisin family serine protease
VEGTYIRPENDHGTHVAGILAGDWRARSAGGLLEEDLIGVCPDLRLYDLRVLDEAGQGDEFAVMAALQFVPLPQLDERVRRRPRREPEPVDPARDLEYACGRTPVCDECERVVSSGVVVVAAAGNQRCASVHDGDGRSPRPISASASPTRATPTWSSRSAHAPLPPAHYGVSYFSSRGPTGDGRSKPDLVAPGEKINRRRAGRRLSASRTAPAWPPRT